MKKRVNRPTDSAGKYQTKQISNTGSGLYQGGR